jgi:hypothetical protein
MVLNRLQRQLENIYEVRSRYRVGDFLIRDPALARELDSSETARELPEKLLIRTQQDAEDVNLGLYLDPELLRRLEANDPTQTLDEHNLHDFWLAIEGISHFLYFTWNAGYERRVSLLEMELQGEVDKYILAAFLFYRQLRGAVPERLHQHLFHDMAYDARLNAAELQRYRRANYFAARFCYSLEKLFLRSSAHANMLNTLRRFYRLTQHHKISVIERLGKLAPLPACARLLKFSH